MMKKTNIPEQEKLIGYLKNLAETEPRDPEAAERGKAQFMKLVEFYKKPVSLRKENRLNTWIGSIPILGSFKERKPMLMTITSILVAMVLVLGGGGVTAYAAQESLPNDALYPLKLQIEDWRLEMTQDPLKDVALMTKFANERVDEIVALANKGETIPAQVMKDLDEHLNAMMAMLGTVTPEQAEDAMVMMERTLRTRDQIQAMAGMPDDVDPALEMFVNRLENHNRVVQECRDDATACLEDPLEFQQQYQFQKDDQAGSPEGETPHQQGNCETPGECEPIGDGPQQGDGVPTGSQPDGAGQNGGNYNEDAPRSGNDNDSGK